MAQPPNVREFIIFVKDLVQYETRMFISPIYKHVQRCFSQSITKFDASNPNVNFLLAISVFKYDSNIKIVTALL